MSSSPLHGAPALTDREREILRLVVTSFVATAGPVGSRALVERYGLGLSPASIRNTMSGLEEAGLLEHPHTSAGRVPTALGYRVFVDELMQAKGMNAADKEAVRAEFDRLVAPTPDGLLRETSKMLGRLSRLLGVVLTPRLATGVLERIEAVPLSSERVMFVLSLRGGLVRTIVLELDAATERAPLDAVVQTLNERLAGLTMDEIRRTYAARVRDVDDRTGLVRLVLERQATVFADDGVTPRVQTSGAAHLLDQPEFRAADELRDLVAMLEHERFFVELLEAHSTPSGRAAVSIGREHAALAGHASARYSIVTASYDLGGSQGTVAVVGPIRMDYPRVVGLVEQVAALLSSPS